MGKKHGLELVFIMTQQRLKVQWERDNTIMIPVHLNTMSYLFDEHVKHVKQADIFPSQNCPEHC